MQHTDQALERRKIAEHRDRIVDALQRADKHITSVCDDVLESDLPDWFADLAFIRETLTLIGAERVIAEEQV